MQNVCEPTNYSIKLNLINLLHKNVRRLQIMETPGHKYGNPNNHHFFQERNRISKTINHQVHRGVSQDHLKISTKRWSKTN